MEETADRGDGATHDTPAVACRKPGTCADRMRHELGRRNETPDPAPVLVDRATRAERQRPSVALHGDGDRPTAVDTRPNARVRRWLTATMRSPSSRPAAAAGVWASTCATSVLGVLDGE